MTKTTTEIEIKTDHLELQQLLKIVGLISTGGEAKIYRAQHDVKVNGEKENRRGRKLFPHDVVTIEGNVYTINKKCS
ncbi:MAG: RNA-binding S4 domain-containing protein [Erysipelotrichia bacterium]|nr:RNA-binding S4 domain-containing protein [Erysipelotrichia bacterium]